MRISDWSSDVCSSDLAGAGIDQVKAHPVERGLRDIQRLQPFGDIMRPAKEAQRLIVQRLKAQRSAVHPGGRKGAEVGRLDARWICLQRDLQFGTGLPMTFRRAEQVFGEGGRSEEGWSGKG